MSLKLHTPTIYYSSGYGPVDANDLYKMAHIFSKLIYRGTKVVFDISPWFLGHVCKSSMENVFRGPNGAYGASQFGEMTNAKVRSLSQRYTVGAGNSLNLGCFLRYVEKKTFQIMCRMLSVLL